MLKKIGLSLLMVGVFMGCEDDSFESQALKDELTLQALIPERAILNGNPSKERILKELNLTTSIGGATITWKSNNSDVISNTGDILEPVGCNEDAKKVSLIAEIGQDAITTERRYNLIVVESPEGLLQEIELNTSKLIDETTTEKDLNITAGYCDKNITWYTTSPYVKTLYPFVLNHMPTTTFDRPKVDVNATIEESGVSAYRSFQFTLERRNKVQDKDILEDVLAHHDMNSTLQYGRYCEYRFDTNESRMDSQCFNITTEGVLLYFSDRYYYDIQSDGDITLYDDKAFNTKAAALLNISSSEFRICYENQHIPSGIATQCLSLDTQIK